MPNSISRLYIFTCKNSNG